MTFHPHTSCMYHHHQNCNGNILYDSRSLNITKRFYNSLLLPNPPWSFLIQTVCHWRNHRYSSHQSKTQRQMSWGPECIFDSLLVPTCSSTTVLGSTIILLTPHVFYVEPRKKTYYMWSPGAQPTRDPDSVSMTNSEMLISYHPVLLALVSPLS